jgi:hypothetical protein
LLELNAEQQENVTSLVWPASPGWSAASVT